MNRHLVKWLALSVALLIATTTQVHSQFKPGDGIYIVVAIVPEECKASLDGHYVVTKEGKISFEEITAAGDLVLRKNPIEDSEEGLNNNPAPCLIDFNKVTSKGQQKKRAQHLAIRASVRGCQFMP